MIRGTTKNIDFGIGAAKNDNLIEALLPKFVDRRNGQFTAAGNWKRRPGYVEAWDLSIDQSIPLLIPEEGGFAVASDGTVFDLGESASSTKSTLKMSGPFRPFYTLQQATAAQAKRIIITDGGPVMTITFAPTRLAVLGGSPPRARFCDTLNDRVLLAGADELTFWWSDLTFPEVWPPENFNILKGDGEHIEMMKVFGRNVYFWKSKSLEIWTDTGTTAFLGRQAYVERGTSSGASVVFTDKAPYWYFDGDFFTLSGASPVVISAAYSREVRKIENPGEVYGFHFEREKLIRWFAPHSHKCFVYDYVTQQFSEDNQWQDGRWVRMPINSYMEMNGKAYFGAYDNTGKIYEWSPDYLDDDGEPIRVYRRYALPLTDNGGFGRANQLRLRFDRGNGTNSTPNPKGLIRWSLDKGAFQSEEIELGAVGEHYPYVDIHSLGEGQEIEIEEIISDPVETLATHAFLTSEQLG